MTPDTLRNPDLLRGTLETLILRALSGGRQHGFGIARWIETEMRGEVRVEGGSLYPALRRLRQRGLIDASWSRSATNRRARYYTLTTTGRRRLRRETEGWKAFSRAVSRVLGS